MQDGLPLHAARHADRSSTSGVAIGAGAPAGIAFNGAAWVPTALLEPVAGLRAGFQHRW
jgi:hypothetical protein